MPSLLSVTTFFFSLYSTWEISKFLISLNTNICMIHQARSISWASSHLTEGFRLALQVQHVQTEHGLYAPLPPSVYSPSVFLARKAAQLPSHPDHPLLPFSPTSLSMQQPSPFGCSSFTALTHLPLSDVPCFLSGSSCQSPNCLFQISPQVIRCQKSHLGSPWPSWQLPILSMQRP